jgi:hypothetical protein
LHSEGISQKQLFRKKSSGKKPFLFLQEMGHMPRSGLGLYGYLVDGYDLKGIVFKLEREVK